jgi:thioredoxin 1
MIELIGKEDFEKVINSEEKILVKFYTPTCNPCKMINPILEQISQELNVKIFAIDCINSDNEEIRNTYNVQSVPTLILFKDGIKKESSVGMKTKDYIINMINAH